MTTELEGPQNNIGKMLESIVHSLVDSPKDVTIEPEFIEAEGVTVFHITTAHVGDAGKLIGKQGRTARSIGTIISAASRKYNLRFAIDIEDDDSSTLPEE